MVNLALSLIYTAASISILIGAWRKGIAESWMPWLAVSASASLALHWTAGLAHDLDLALYLATLSIFALSWLRAMWAWDQPEAQRLLSYRAAMRLGTCIAALARLVIRARRRSPEPAPPSEESAKSALAEEHLCSATLSLERVTEGFIILVTEEEL